MILSSFRKCVIALLCLATVLTVSACGSAEPTKEKQNKEETAKGKKIEEDDNWNYEEQKKWPMDSGKMQSPIDLRSKTVQKMTEQGKLKLQFDPVVSYIEDNGHSIQVGGKGAAKINGRTFDFKQVHFHAESEHTLEGKHFPLEAHFVHQSTNGRLAVIGVFFKEGKENKAFGDILKNIKKGKKVEKTEKVNIAEMLPNNQQDYYHYLGSLTTPPLSENVEWYVLNQPVEVSAAQIKKFGTYYNDNNRDIQPIGDRPVLEHSTAK
ncbi:carbonic anhydrase family protein [Aciduricibacillus chroicocephali]|uniref:Carbonic anhydrase n=1 Tax=Aciduricibacillus chroicocephali TaxID=3054939 RepID=A0ABY9KZF5_9BACI|nr:carbonic anhydrase family protein [Bacillaceae bacterium 44XB]